MVRVFLVAFEAIKVRIVKNKLTKECNFPVGCSFKFELPYANLSLILEIHDKKNKGSRGTLAGEESRKFESLNITRRG